MATKKKPQGTPRLKRRLKELDELIEEYTDLHGEYPNAKFDTFVTELRVQRAQVADLIGKTSA